MFRAPYRYIVLIAVGLFLLGLGWGGTSGKFVLDARGSDRWPATSGEVLAAELDELVPLQLSCSMRPGREPAPGTTMAETVHG